MTFRQTIHSLKVNLPKLIYQLLLLDAVRYWVAYVRFFYFTKIRKSLRTLDIDSGDVSTNTVMHNLKGLSALASTRSMLLINPLACLKNPTTLNSRSRILSIGPRTEGEILCLMGHGFRQSYIRGLDLISYSPWVDLGDMHEMPYEDSSWDVVILGWVIAYSENPVQAAKEVVRILRPGGIVAVGVQYSPLSRDEVAQQAGYQVGGRTPIQSTQQILNFFGDAVKHVYFNHDVLSEGKDEATNLMVLFTVDK